MLTLFLHVLEDILELLRFLGVELDDGLSTTHEKTSKIEFEASGDGRLGL